MATGDKKPVLTGNGIRVWYEEIGSDDKGVLYAPVSSIGHGKPGTPGTGTAAASAAAIGSSQVCLSVLLINTDASLSLLWGNSSSQVVPLAAGSKVSIPATNVNQVYVKNGTGSASFAYMPIVAA
jgi:hypothetical protein